MNASSGMGQECWLVACYDFHQNGAVQRTFPSFHIALMSLSCATAQQHSTSAKCALLANQRDRFTAHRRPAITCPNTPITSQTNSPIDFDRRRSPSPPISIGYMPTMCCVLVRSGALFRLNCFEITNYLILAVAHDSIIHCIYLFSTFLAFRVSVVCFSRFSPLGSLTVDRFASLGVAHNLSILFQTHRIGWFCKVLVTLRCDYQFTTATE